MKLDWPISHQVLAQLCMSGHYLYHRFDSKGGQMRVLTALLEQPEMLQRELQDQLGIQSGSLSEIIIKMEAGGLLERVRSSRDGRHIVLKLTAEGIERGKYLRIRYGRQAERMMSCFSEEELGILHELLGRMLVHWEGVENDAELVAPSGFDGPHGPRGMQIRK